MIARLVSGGQSGVDQAALDAALELGVPCGGWCPRGRKAEDGPIPDRYPLVETPSRKYSQRTRWNIRDSDATLILAWSELTGGTLLTANQCRRTGTPYVENALASGANTANPRHAARDWIKRKLAGGVLNVAGPRASEDAGVYDRAREFVQALLGGERPQAS